MSIWNLETRWVIGGEENVRSIVELPRGVE